MISHESVQIQVTHIQVDDCWNRIGIYGDRSCERLSEHVHCHNCERYSAAAIQLLDRYSLAREQQSQQEQAQLEQTQQGISVLVFRLGDEWLALPSKQLVEVGPLRAIHSLPHQRSPALLGVSNVRGTLVACLSLAALLGLDPGSSVIEGRRIVPRMLVLAAEGGPLVVPVDEVAGIERVLESQIRPANSLAQQAASQFAQGVLQWREQSLTLLDEERLTVAMARALA